MDNKNIIKTSNKVFVYGLFFVSVILIVIGVVLSFNLKEEFNDKDNVDGALGTISTSSITLKKVKGYTYSVDEHEIIKIKNDKYTFFIIGVDNFTISDEQLNDISVGFNEAESEIVDKGSKILSNGKDFKYISYINHKSDYKGMIFYYNVLDSYTLTGSIMCNNFNSVYDEVVKIFDGIIINTDNFINYDDSDVDESFEIEEIN